ncbi:MAG: ATP-binding cassette domain-containing protein, partial [Gaiellaceae bacterium]
MPIRQEAQLHSITLADVTAGHGVTEVLSHASLTVGEGSRIGVVGPNGAGKTTLLRLLAGLEEPERGRVRLNPRGLSVGYLPQELDSALSGGQARRAALAALFRAGHDVYCLDEPTNDLDFEGLDWLERLVQGTRGSVVVVSHDREFLDRTVGRIVELEEGTRRLREWP